MHIQLGYINLPLIVYSTKLNSWCGNQETLASLQVPGSFLGHQMILSPHRVLGPHKVLSPPTVLVPHRVLGSGSSFSGMPYLMNIWKKERNWLRKTLSHLAGMAYLRALIWKIFISPRWDVGKTKWDPTSAGSLLIWTHSIFIRVS